MTLRAYISPAFIILILGILTLAAPWPAQAQLAPYTRIAESEAALSQGKIYTDVWRDKTRENGAVDVYGAVDIAASPDIIWNIMRNCERSKDIVMDMTSCEILSRSPDESWDIRRQVFKVGFLLPKVKTEFRSDYVPYNEIKITRTGADMKVQDGIWTLTPLNSRVTRVTYRAAILPKFPIPRGLLKKGTRKDTPKVLAKLRDESLKDMALQKVSVKGRPEQR